MFRRIFMLTLLAWAPLVAAESVLYATSIRTHYEGDAPQIECNLYKVDAANGASTLLAPLRVDGTIPVAVISLVVHPRTAMVYGITAGLQPAIPASLVTIDPVNGVVKRIGPLGHVASDLAFSRDGTLYAWIPTRNRLARIDLSTGAATPLDDSGIVGIMGGGMAIDDKDVGYVTATGASGTLDSVDIHTGHGASGPQLDGAPYLSAITNLSFSPQGKLYGVNTNMGAPASTALVTIDPLTGKVTELGRLPNDSHALIFVSAGFSEDTWRSPGIIAMIAAAIVLVIALAYGVTRWLRA